MTYRTRKRKVNWGPTIEVIIGGLAWALVCFITFWAIMMSLEKYTTN